MPPSLCQGFFVHVGTRFQCFGSLHCILALFPDFAEPQVRVPSQVLPEQFCVCLWPSRLPEICQLFKTLYAHLISSFLKNVFRQLLVFSNCYCYLRQLQCWTIAYASFRHILLTKGLFHWASSRSGQVNKVLRVVVFRELPEKSDKNNSLGIELLREFQIHPDLLSGC